MLVRAYKVSDRERERERERENMYVCVYIYIHMGAPPSRFYCFHVLESQMQQTDSFAWVGDEGNEQHVFFSAKELVRMRRVDHT